jgi:hypothetical protein
MFNSFTLKLVMLLLLSLNMIACTGTTDSPMALPGINTNIVGDLGTDGGTTDLQTAKITLSWVAPTTWLDDTAISLSQIGGYRLYYGPTANDTPNMVDISDPSLWQHTLTLDPGTYYFRISTYDVNGIEGPKSEAISDRV